MSSHFITFPRKNIKCIPPRGSHLLLFLRFRLRCDHSGLGLWSPRHVALLGRQLDDRCALVFRDVLLLVVGPGAGERYAVASVKAGTSTFELWRVYKLTTGKI